MRGKRLLKLGLWALAAAAVLAAAAAAAGRWLVPEGVRSAAERAVREASGGAARIGRVDASLWRGQIRLGGVEARHLALGAVEADLRVDEIRLHVERRALLRGALHILSVTLDRPALAVRAAREPRRGTAAVLAAPFGAGHVTARRGSLTYEDARLGLRAEAAGLEVSAARGADGLGVAARAEGGRVAAGGLTIAVGPVAAQGALRAGELALASLALEALGSVLRARGTVGWSAAGPVVDLAVEGTGDLGVVARLAQSPAALGGRMTLAGTVKGAARDVTFRGSARAAEVAVGGHVLRSVGVAVTLDRRLLRIERARFALWDGAVRGEGACRWETGGCQGRAEGRGLDLAQAAPGAGMRGRLSGVGTFTGPAGGADAGAVSLTASGAAVHAGGLALGEVALEARLERDRVAAEGTAFGGASPFRVTGRWSPRLALEVAVDRVDARMLAGVAEGFRPGGTLRASGALAGPWADPTFSGAVAWERPEGMGLAWDSAEGSVTVNAAGLVVDSATFRAGSSVLRLRGTARRGVGVAAGAPGAVLELAGEAEGTLEDLGRAAGVEARAAGRFTMALRLRGPVRRPEGEAQLTLRDLALGPLRWERGEARARLAAGGLRLEAATFSQGATHLEARGEIGEGGRLALDVAAADLDLAALVGTPGVAGRLSGRGRLTGTVAEPVADATVTLSAVSWEGSPLGEWRGRLSHAGARTELGLRQEGGRLSLLGTVTGGGEGRADLSITAQEVDAAPLLARAGDPRLAGALVRAGGTARLAFPLGRPREARGDAALTLLEVALAGETWRAEGPVAVRLSPQAVEVPAAALRGRLGAVRVAGTLQDHGRWAWTLQGPVPLATAALWAPGIEGAGTAAVNLAVSAAGGIAEARGSIHLLADRLRVAGLPWELQRVECRVSVDGGEAAFGPGHAALAGGTLTGTGRASRLAPRRWEHRWTVQLEGADGAHLAGALGAGAGNITGTAGGAAELTFIAGEGAEPLRTLGGPAQVRFQGGRLFRSPALAKVLELLNMAPLRRWRPPDLAGAGMAYRELAISAHLDGGIADVRELRLEGDTLRLAGAGTVDLPRREVRMLLAVRPFVTLDDVVGRVPLVGPALLGKKGGLLTLAYEVSGPVEDPAVRLAGARTLGRALVERLLRGLGGLGEQEER